MAIDLVVDPDRDAARFRLVRKSAQTMPEIVRPTVMTPYPGTETWHTESRRMITGDNRLFDIRHAVVPSRLPLEGFHRERVGAQTVIDRKHLGLRTALAACRVARNVPHGQADFARMPWRRNAVRTLEPRLADDRLPVRYELPPPRPVDIGDRQRLSTHARPPRSRG
ncbi:hypothetical protein WBG99_31880 [Streptomyces sp. TG1A-60]|uniref:hypothetical protein n=1 Tax=Streptomyces sp. TG1A-60 TaxID=3129111 RepID=UPI0030D2BB43